MTHPLVSVVMIFKDAAPFLAEAAQSVLTQSYPEVELVLVDDGGTDGSDAIASGIAASAPSATVVSHPGRENRGMSAARALGISVARGEFTAFLDADDRWDPGHLDHEVRLLRAHPEAGMVCGRSWRWSSWEGTGAVDQLAPLAFAPGVVVEPPRLLAAVLRNGSLATPTCSLLVRTDVLRESGGPVARFTGMFEDQVLNSLLQVRVPAVMSGATTAWYRQHDGSATALAEAEGTYHPDRPNESRRAFLAWLSGLAEVRDGRDPELDALLDTAVHEQVASAERRSGPMTSARALLKRVLPTGTKASVGSLLTRRGLVRLRVGSMLFTSPVSREFGFDRGQPIDRFYIERFLGWWGEDVRGRVLEVGDSSYTTRFGGNRVTRADVLNVNPGVPGTTFVADLADAESLPSEAFDCVLLTQTLHLVFDVQAAAHTLRRVLRPGGVLLLTVPGISPVSTDEWATTWYWSFTQHAARRLFQGVFGDDDVEVRQHGNATAATAFVQGLAADELSEKALVASDEQFPVIITVRAVRPVEG